MNAESLIVIVSYNSENFIENCLKSILEQDYKNWFLVVVDNNSKDETISKIKEFRNLSPKISSHNFKLITLKKNIGFSAAINYAVFEFILKKKKELEKELKYLVLINPDVYLSGDALKNLILPFETESFRTGNRGDVKISSEDSANIADDTENISYLQEQEIGVAGGLILDYEKDTIQHLGGRVSSNFITSHIGYGMRYEDLQDKYRNLEKSQKIIQNTEQDTELNTGKEVSHGSSGKEYKEYADKEGAKNNLNIKENLKEVDYVTGALFATPLWIFKKIGGFDSGYRPAYYEELDYCIKIKRTGRKVVVNPYCVARHFEGASVKKFSKRFYKHYHKNRIRCAIINMSFFNFSREFFKEEFKWYRIKATKDQFTPLLYAYFLNFLFLPYNLTVKVKNYLTLRKLMLKVG